jgi:hypothetical protein
LCKVTTYFDNKQIIVHNILTSIATTQEKIINIIQYPFLHQLHFRLSKGGRDNRTRLMREKNPLIENAVIQ